jgi:hypothetical protein
MTSVNGKNLQKMTKNFQDFQLPISLLIRVKKKVWFARKLMSKIRKNATISGGSLVFIKKLQNYAS